MTRFISAALALLFIATAAAELPPSVRSSLGLTSSSEPEVPDPEQVFLFSAKLNDNGSATLRFDIADCCYLYREKIRIRLVTNKGADAPGDARLGQYVLPSGKAKIDEFIG